MNAVSFRSWLQWASGLDYLDNLVLITQFFDRAGHRRHEPTFCLDSKRIVQVESHLTADHWLQRLLFIFFGQRDVPMSQGAVACLLTFLRLLRNTIGPAGESLECACRVSV